MAELRFIPPALAVMIAWAIVSPASASPVSAGEAIGTAPLTGLVQLAATRARVGPTARRLRRLGSNVPVPTERPADLDTVVKPDQAQEEPVVAEPEPQEPDPTPEVTESETAAPTEEAAPSTKPVACQIANAQFTPIRLLPEDNSECGVENAVLLSSVGTRTAVELSTPPTLQCGFAQVLADFAENLLQPLAQYHLGSAVTAMATGPGYTCRRRNNAADGKLSEHAFGNALDITAFALADGRSVAINETSASGGTAEARFLKALRSAACGLFTTVLGPGSDAAHSDHLHIDRGRIAPDKRPFLICQ